jgi:hypothetical protein
MLKIGGNPEAAENVICLTEPAAGFIVPVPPVQLESAVKYITGGETGSWPVRTDHHPAKMKL